MTCAAFSIKFAKTNQKFAENSEFCEKIDYFIVNYSLLSLVVDRRVHGRRVGPALLRRRLRVADAAALLRDPPLEVRDLRLWPKFAGI